MNERKDLLLDLAQKLIEAAKNDKTDVYIQSIQSMESSVEYGSNPSFVTKRFTVSFLERLSR